MASYYEYMQPYMTWLLISPHCLPPSLSHSSHSLKLSYSSRNGSSTFSSQELCMAIRSAWKTLLPERSPANFLFIQKSLFKYLPSQRPSQALLAKTINHPILIHLFCSTSLKSCDLLFSLTCLSVSLMQRRFHKSGTLLMSPST